MAIKRTANKVSERQDCINEYFIYRSHRIGNGEMDRIGTKKKKEEEKEGKNQKVPIVIRCQCNSLFKPYNTDGFILSQWNAKI